MAEAAASPGETARDEAARDEAVEITRDRFFGGRLILQQPAKGHRFGTDAVLLAAAVPRDFAGLVCDVGAGVGAAGLGGALAAPSCRVELLERDGVAAQLAAANIAANGLGDRADVLRCDLFASDAKHRGRADLVLTNPPFYNANRTRSSPVAGRRSAHVLDECATLTAWLRACLALLAPRGALVLVHTPEALPEALVALAVGAGEIVVKGVHPRAGEPARRILIRAVKGSRAPCALSPPLVLHDGPDFTHEADLLHRGEAALRW